MEFNQNIIKGKWTEIKGEMKKAWGNLTDDELEQTKGDLTSIRGLLQQKLGKSQEDYKGKFDRILERFHEERDGAAEDIKENLRH